MKSALNQPLIIHGCGGHARSMADVALANNKATQILFIDTHLKENKQLFGFPVVDTLPSDFSADHLIAIGDNQKRMALFQQLREHQIKFTSLVAQSAYLGKDHKIGQNVFIGHQAHIGPCVVIGDNTIINTRCIIEHDCHIGKHSHISVNAVIAGACELGDFVTIGAGATVIDNIKIAANITIGAGAVVVSDLTEPGVYVGVPAKRL